MPVRNTMVRSLHDTGLAALRASGGKDAVD